MKSEVQKTTGRLDLNFIVFELIKKGFRPSKICHKLDLKKSTLQYYLSTLKRSGFIKKVGYGTWEILKEYNEKEVQKTTKVTPHQLRNNLNFFKPDSVRGHAFQFKFKIGKIRNWEKREQILGVLNIPFDDLKIGGVKRGQRLKFKGKKIWLTNSSIIIYEKASYMADTAKLSKSRAVYDVLTLIKQLEGYLRANFKINNKYIFKVTRQHYSLMKNALAKQYNKEGNNLQVYNETGLWFTIDNSFNLQEAETLHPKTADIDNEKVQNFFNGLKGLEGYTPGFVVKSLATQTQNLDNYAVHLKAHVKSVKDLGKGVKDLVEVIKELKK